MAKFNSIYAAWCFEGVAHLAERMREAVCRCRSKLYRPKIPSGDGVAKTPDQFRGIAVRGGKQRILFAEDNPALGEVTGEFLQKAGYEVLAAKDGLEAVDLFGRNLSLVDLLHDVMMPGHDGSEAFARTNSLRPDIPLTSTTGYATVVNLIGAGVQAQPTILLYPYRNLALARKLRRMLDKRKRQRFCEGGKSHSYGSAG